MSHNLSTEAEAANNAQDTMTHDLVVITLPDPVDPITLYLATATIVVDGQQYDGRIQTMPQIANSEGGIANGGDFTIDNVQYLFGPTFLNTDRVLDGASVVITRVWRLPDGSFESFNPDTGETYEIGRGVLRVQPIDDSSVKCNFIADVSDSSVLIGGDPIYQHCPKFFRVNGTHPLGGPCGWLTTLLQNQVETATVLGAITGSGNAQVVLTAPGMTGSPKTLNVAVLSGDDASAVATKIRTALSANSDVSAWFTIAGSDADIIFTKKTAAAINASINMSITNGTCTGLTAAPTSENTSALKCDKTVSGPNGCAVHGNTRHGGIGALTPNAASTVTGTGGGLTGGGDGTGGYGGGVIPRKLPMLDIDNRFPF